MVLELPRIHQFCVQLTEERCGNTIIVSEPWTTTEVYINDCGDKAAFLFT